jgi:nucleoside-diphosphate-sugar epimerase
MRALVTGGTGFVGNHLISELRRKGWEVVCIARRLLKTVDPGIVCLTGDLLKPDSMKYDKSQMGKIDVVFHLAAMLPSHLPLANLSLYLMANAVATSHLLDLAADWEVGSFVYASSLAVIGKPECLPVTESHPLRPSHPYAISKLCGELLCEMARRAQHRRISSLRITSPYGPGMPYGVVIAAFVRNSIRSEDLSCFGTGQRTQNFVHISDVVRACLLAAESDNPGVFNIAGSSSISMKSLAELIVRLTPGSCSEVRMSGTPDPQDDYRWEIDLASAESGLGYLPKVSLEQGLADCIEFTRSGVTVQRWWNTP